MEKLFLLLFTHIHLEGPYDFENIRQFARCGTLLWTFVDAEYITAEDKMHCQKDSTQPNVT